MSTIAWGRSLVCSESCPPEAKMAGWTVSQRFSKHGEQTCCFKTNEWELKKVPFYLGVFFRFMARGLGSWQVPSLAGVFVEASFLLARMVGLDSCAGFVDWDVCVISCVFFKQSVWSIFYASRWFDVILCSGGSSQGLDLWGGRTKIIVGFTISLHGNSY